METTKRQNVKTKQRKSRRQIAQAITDDLFTSGSGTHGSNLHLHTEDGRYLGGWCKEAVVSRILKHFRRASL